MTTTTRPGLREALYLGGRDFKRRPVPILRWDWAETRDRTRDGSLLVDSLYPEDGFPTRLSKLHLELRWGAGSIPGEDLDHLGEILSSGEPFDVCPWIPLTESYRLLGPAISGVLTRRHAPDVLSVLPLGASTRYPCVGRRADGTPFEVDRAAPDEDGRVAWAASGTGIGGELVAVRYYPTFRMYAAEGQPDYSIAFAEGARLTLEEL